MATLNLKKIPEYAQAKSVMIYLSAFGEIDTSYIAEELLSGGVKLTVPVTDKGRRVITPCLLSELDELTEGAYGIPEPKCFVPADKTSLDVVIVPGTVFDANGGRMGFGAGYYDRFLSDIGAVRIGLCHDFQLVPDTYPEPHDAMMNYIVTERRIIRCGKKL